MTVKEDWFTTGMRLLVCFRVAYDDVLLSSDATYAVLLSAHPVGPSKRVVRGSPTVASSQSTTQSTDRTVQYPSLRS